jgi:hypothetical protein
MNAIADVVERAAEHSQAQGDVSLVVALNNLSRVLRNDEALTLELGRRMARALREGATSK